MDRLSATLLARLARALPLEERDAVLGDLWEEKRSSVRSIAAVLSLIAWKTWTTRELRWTFAWSNNSTCDDGAERSWAEWAVPLVLGLGVAAATVSVLLPGHVRIPTVSALLVRSASLLFAAAVAAIIGAFAAHRFYREYFARPGKWLLACAWTTAIWVPLVLLAWPQRAMWFVLTPIPIAAALAISSKRQYVAMQEFEPAHESRRETLLFESGDAYQQVGPQPIAIVLSILLQLTLLTAAADDLATTASLVVLTTASFAWAFTPGAFNFRGFARRRSRYVVLPCFLLTCLALLPFLSAGMAYKSGNNVSLQPLLRSVPHLVRQDLRVHTTVVLLAPTRPHRKLVPVVIRSRSIRGAVRPVHPLHIPFDGSYWFALNDQTGIGNDVRVVHGDPASAHIHSTDWTPLKMEAHQELGARLDAGCCTSLDVTLQNADYRPGLIQVELLLRDVQGKEDREVSLGSQPIRSSIPKAIPTDRAPVVETLHFKMNARASHFEFSEIDLRFKLAQGRNLAGAQVKVLGFTLQP